MEWGLLATFSRLCSLRLFRPTLGTQNRPLEGSKMTPGRPPNRYFGVQMGPFPSLRSSFASPFDVGPNLKRLEANLLQVSCHSCSRLALFSNIAHVTKHCKTLWISMFFPKFISTRALRKRSERRSETMFAKASFRGKRCKLLHHLGDPIRRF